MEISTHPQAYCEICDHDHTTAPALILARWHDLTVCLDCLAAYAADLVEEENDAP